MNFLNAIGLPALTSPPLQTLCVPVLPRSNCDKKEQTFFVCECVVYFRPRSEAKDTSTAEGENRPPPVFNRDNSRRLPLAIQPSFLLRRCAISWSQAFHSVLINNVQTLWVWQMRCEHDFQYSHWTVVVRRRRQVYCSSSPAEHESHSDQICPRHAECWGCSPRWSFVHHISDLQFNRRFNSFCPGETISTACWHQNRSSESFTKAKPQKQNSETPNYLVYTNHSHSEFKRNLLQARSKGAELFGPIDKIFGAEFAPEQSCYWIDHNQFDSSLA